MRVLKAIYVAVVYEIGSIPTTCASISRSARKNNKNGTEGGAKRGGEGRLIAGITTTATMPHKVGALITHKHLPKPQTRDARQNGLITGLLDILSILPAENGSPFFSSSARSSRSGKSHLRFDMSSAVLDLWNGIGRSIFDPSV